MKKLKMPLFILALLVVLLIVDEFILGLQFKKRHADSIVDTPKSLVKKLPDEVKKQVSKITPAAYYRVPILMYHYVEYVKDKHDSIRQSLNVEPDIFESQLKTLKDAGYTFLMARDLGAVIDGIRPVPDKPVILTFDDGHWDMDTVVLPLLEKYDAKATSYIITDYVGGSDFLKQKQIDDLIKSNLVEIGAHTVNHISLKKQSLKRVMFEVTESKKMLEDTYHISVVSFAYPNGEFDVQAAEEVKNAGYTTAVSTVPGVEQTKHNRYFLYRLRPGRRTGKELINLLENTTFKPLER